MSTFTSLEKKTTEGEKEKEREGGIICVKIYDNLALEAWI